MFGFGFRFGFGLGPGSGLGLTPSWRTVRMELTPNECSRHGAHELIHILEPRIVLSEPTRAVQVRVHHVREDPLFFRPTHQCVMHRVCGRGEFGRAVAQGAREGERRPAQG